MANDPQNSEGSPSPDAPSHGSELGQPMPHSHATWELPARAERAPENPLPQAPSNYHVWANAGLKPPASSARPPDHTDPRDSATEASPTSHESFRSVPRPHDWPPAPPVAPSRPVPGHPVRTERNQPDPYPVLPLHETNSAHLHDSDYFGIPLLSGFRFYPFSQLHVKRVNGRAQAKIIRAAKEGNNAYLFEAVCSLLSVPEHGLLLTTQDYMHVLYWLRQASYTQFSWDHTFLCYDPKHLSLVAQGKKTTGSLSQLVKVAATDLQETHLSDDQYQSIRDMEDMLNPLLAKQGLCCTYMSCRDLVETESILIKSEDVDPSGNVQVNTELRWALDQATMIRELPGQPPISLTQRLAIVQEMSADVLDGIGLLINLHSAYGVAESITARCMECGAETKTRVGPVSAHTFCR